MILDDPPPTRNGHPNGVNGGAAMSSGASTISMSSFPPRAPLSDYYYAQQQQAQEPLLPYAIRHPVPINLAATSPPPLLQHQHQPPPPQHYYGGSATSPPFNPNWGQLISGRGRYKLVLIAGGAALLFLLHAHFYRPRGHDRHHPPPWAFQPPPPREGTLAEMDAAGRPAPDGVPPGVPNRWGQAGAPAQAPPPLEPLDRPLPTLVQLPKFDDAEFDILPIEQFIQKRRPVPPSFPDPWVEVKDPHWKGREWLDPERFDLDDEGGKEVGSEEWEEKHRSPPARFLLRAYRFTSLSMKKFAGESKSRLAPGTAWDESTGRPKIVERENLFLNPKEWKGPKVKVANVELGKDGVKKLEKVQFDGEWDMREEKVEEESQRRDWVKRAFLHVWTGYKQHAWGHDELRPLTNSSSDGYNGWGASIVDNLDTLLIMGLSGEYNLAREHVAAIDFSYLVPNKMPFSTVLPLEDDMVVPGDEQAGVAAGEQELDTGPQGGGVSGNSGSGILQDTDEEDSLEEDEEKEEEKREKKLKEKKKKRTINSRAWSVGNEWRSPSSIPVFETTIRYLGGLLSAYDLSGDPLMLKRAKELGDWILPALGTKEGLSLGRLVLGSNPNGLPGGRVILSEAGSLSMEFTRLSMLTGDETYYRAVQRSTDALDSFPPGEPLSKDPQAKNRGRLGALLPANLDPGHPKSLAGEYTFGGLADSYYEYLIKEYQLLGGSVKQYETMYEESLESAYEYLIKKVDVVPGRHDLTIVGTRAWGLYSPKLEHLTCFAGGMLGLGSRLLRRPQDLDTAVNVTNTCAWMYESTATGVGPESLIFYNEKDTSRYSVVDHPTGVGKARKPRGTPVGVKSSNPRQIGRPEAIESVMYMYRLTGDRKWQDQGWIMFTKWVEHSIVASGFATVQNVNFANTKKADSMESFVMAETLKYFYLLFSPPDTISLDDYVFNTEAHPFIIPKPSPSKPQRLWTGPSPSSTASFAPTGSEGTWIQLWSRVQQCAALAKPRNIEPMNAPGGRKPIRPSEAELEAVMKEQERLREMNKGKNKLEGMAVDLGGGGRGMGARPGGAKPGGGH